MSISTSHQIIIPLICLSIQKYLNKCQPPPHILKYVHIFSARCVLGDDSPQEGDGTGSAGAHPLAVTRDQEKQGKVHDAVATFKFFLYINGACSRALGRGIKFAGSIPDEVIGYFDIILPATL
jgi:hypothetical protein